MGKPTALYVVRCARAWDGDSFGNEWTCGAAVHKDQDGYCVYEDDGAGNGNALARFSSLFDARRYADLHVKHLDEGGYAGSGTHIEICRLAEARGLS
jgi:hypothetical protein